MNSANIWFRTVKSALLKTDPRAAIAAERDRMANEGHPQHDMLNQALADTQGEYDALQES